MTNELNTAQKMNAAWLGVDLDWYTTYSAFVAVDQTQAMVAGYEAPHAQRGTPPRPRHEKTTRYVMSKAHDKMIPVRRPFKGHRP